MGCVLAVQPVVGMPEPAGTTELVDRAPQAAELLVAGMALKALLDKLVGAPPESLHFLAAVQAFDKSAEAVAHMQEQVNHTDWE